MDNNININIEDDYKSVYWHSSDMMCPSEEALDSYFDEEAISVGGYYDSSSPDGTQSSSSSKNIVSERNRRKKLNERLYALRSVVPNITKMDKASIIKDAIEYIQSLHDEERRIQAEISELESGRPSSSSTILDELDHIQDSTTTFSSDQNRSTRISDQYYYGSSAAPSTLLMPSSPIELLELRVSSMGERTIVVSLTCSKRTDTMVKLCDVFESLNLKIITANITAFSGWLLKTVFLEGDQEEREVLSSKIRAAVAALNDPDSPMST